MTINTVQIPGYVAGRWHVDPVHSDAAFTVRHLVSKVRGRFRTMNGEIRTAADPLDSSVTISIDPSSVDTGNDRRDDHLRSADFLEVERYPAMTFTSTGLRPNGENYRVDGDLTIKGVTKPVTSDLELGGFALDPGGVPRAGFTATFEIDRHDYGVDFSMVLETGGVMVGDRVWIQLDVEAVLQPG